LRRLWRERFQAINWRYIPFAAVLAYTATLIANTTRIGLALELRARAVKLSGLTNNQLHRLEGILVYFGFLLLLFLLTEKLESAKPLRLARVLPFPLLIYYATTLGIPLLNGSFKRGAFWEHAIFVLVLPLVFVIPAMLFNLLATASRSDESASRQAPSTRGSFVWRRLRIPETERRQSPELQLRSPNQSA
jgi:hypothetical protein